MVIGMSDGKQQEEVSSNTLLARLGKKKKKDPCSLPPQSTEAAQLNEVGPKACIGEPGCRYTDHA